MTGNGQQVVESINWNLDKRYNELCYQSVIHAFVILVVAVGRYIIQMNLFSLSIGLGSGWVSPIMYRLKLENFPITTADNALLASIAFYCKSVSPFIMYAFADKIGRKRLMILTTLMLSINWALLYSYKSVFTLICARGVMGFGIGLLHSILPLYVSEASCPQLRGTMMTCGSLFQTFGELSALVMLLFYDYYTSHATFAVISFFALLSTFFVVETPQFEVLKGRQIEAKKRYMWFNGDDYDAEKNFDKMVQNLKWSASKSQLRLLIDGIKSNSNVGVSFRIVLVCSFLFYLTGMPAVHVYLTTLISDGLDDSEESQWTVNIMTISISAVVPLGAYISSFIFDRFNRKTIMSMMCGMGALLMTSLAVIYILDQFYTPIAYRGYYICTILLVYHIVLGAFNHPIVACVRGEVLSPSVKVLGMACAVFVGSMGSATSTSIFLPLSKLAGGLYANFLLFAGVNLILLVYAHYELPETKGKTLEQIQEELPVDRRPLLRWNENGPPSKSFFLEK